MSFYSGVINYLTMAETAAVSAVVQVAALAAVSAVVQVAAPAAVVVVVLLAESVLALQWDEALAEVSG
ncbi:MAG: hypothetical protein RMK65_06845 [Anaerolineae bacterium]|nr:hypothetical protein [Anaerolineae bacterium]